MVTLKDMAAAAAKAGATAAAEYVGLARRNPLAHHAGLYNVMFKL